jgi:hypothetical protein
MLASIFGVQLRNLMSPDVWFLLVLAIKMAVVAAFVVTASFVAERAGALVGAMVVTLPIATGPAYILLALDHGAAFIADSTVASLAVHAASGIFGMAYVLAAQRRSFAVTIAVAVATWIACAIVIRAIAWSVPGAILLNVAAFGVCVPLAQRYLHVRMPVITRRWFDVPLRASLVAALVGTVVMLGDSVGPQLAGMFAVFPIVMLSIMLILHPRIGGVATAALIANAMWGLVGFALAVLTLHVTAVPFGAPLALASALAVSVGVNCIIFMVRRAGHAARAAALNSAASPGA